MSSVALEIGDKLHIITRRLFVDDLRRHFIGEIIGFENCVYKLQGYTFVYTANLATYNKIPELRERIFSFNDSAGYIINKIPQNVEIASLKYIHNNSRLIITDQYKFSMDVNEFAYKL